MAKIQVIGLVIMTVLTLAVITHSHTPDCNDPATWGTAQGVQHCAVTPSK